MTYVPLSFFAELQKSYCVQRHHCPFMAVGLCQKKSASQLRTTVKKPLVKKVHPLLRLLHMMLVEAQRYHRVTLRTNDSFSSLHQQLDFLWVECGGEALEKYEFLRNRLSLVYLWKDSSSGECFSRCLMNPPTHLASKFHCTRQMLLAQLKTGDLFVEQ